MTGKPLIKKIISGGQTGADRAALDHAIRNGIPHGGWIPRGRKTENGRLPEEYRLQEMPTASYPQRTEQNVLDSDGTLIVSHGPLKGGSALTRKMALRHGKPCLHIDLDRTTGDRAGIEVREWIRENGIEVLNIAGSRASDDPGIYQATLALLARAAH